MAIILPMTSRPAQSKILLVAEPRPEGAAATPAPIRRFRIARLPLEGRQSAAGSRSDRLKHAHG